jgi:hypothetical protein
MKAAPTMQRLDRGTEFVSCLEALRARYRIKRNFGKLVEKERQALYL